MKQKLLIASIVFLLLGFLLDNNTFLLSISMGTLLGSILFDLFVIKFTDEEIEESNRIFNEIDNALHNDDYEEVKSYLDHFLNTYMDSNGSLTIKYNHVNIRVYLSSLITRVEMLEKFNNTIEKIDTIEIIEDSVSMVYSDINVSSMDFYKEGKLLKLVINNKDV